MEKSYHVRKDSNFYQFLDYYKIRTWTNFENPNGKSLDLHLQIHVYVVCPVTLAELAFTFLKMQSSNSQLSFR